MLYTLVTEPFYRFCSASTGLKRSHPAKQRSNFVGITRWLFYYVTLLTDKHTCTERQTDRQSWPVTIPGCCC